MVKINKRIEIVRSTGYGLSSMNAESSEAIYKVLSKHYSHVTITIANRLSDFEALAAREPDLVFLGMKFVLEDQSLGLQNSEKIWISQYLDNRGISYTGSNQAAHECGVNKPLAKRNVLDANLKTSQFYVIGQNQQYSQDNILLNYPLFVKPTSRGGGLGIDSYSMVNNFTELQSKVASIASNLHSDSLIEEYLPGREFSVAILQDEHSEDLLVMPIELIAPPNENGVCMLSEQVKSSNSERVLEVMEESIKSKITALAGNAFNVLGGQDYGRIDIRLDSEGIPHFLEANLMPNLIDGYGSFPKACLLNNELDYEQMILRIVSLAFDRSEKSELTTNGGNLFVDKKDLVSSTVLA